MDTISYLSGGALGDFIHQLSVMNEMFIKTGKKADLYIFSNIGTDFNRPVEVTFNDIYSVIVSQEYISSFKMYSGEKIDVNLSEWKQRDIINSWRYIFGIYDIEWGKTPFLKRPTIEYGNGNVVFISTTTIRWPSQICFNTLIDKIKTPGREVVFLCSEIRNYDHFKTTTGISMPYMLCDTFESLVDKINGCLFLVATLSMHLAVADGLFKDRIALYCDNIYDVTISKNTNSNGISHVDEIDKIKFLDRI